MWVAEISSLSEVAQGPHPITHQSHRQPTICDGGHMGYFLFHAIAYFGNSELPKAVLRVVRTHNISSVFPLLLLFTLVYLQYQHH